MNNKELYIDVMSGIQPSEEVIERIMDMTVSKKDSKRFSFKRFAYIALVFTLIVLVGSGFKFNQYISNKTPVTNSQVVQSSTNPLSVMVAYAGEYKSISEIKAGSMNEQPIFYSIHFADITDEKASAEAEKLYESDKSSLKQNMNTLSSKGHSSVMHSGKSTVDSAKGEATVKVYVLSGGMIALDNDDYSNVKNMTISTTSKFGELDFNYVTKAKSKGTQQIGKKVSISGKELQESQNSTQFECDSSPTVNKGYELFWGISDDVYQAIGNDLNFDLSQIKDTITFTVEYNDGTVQTASLNLYFDSDGYMHFE